MSTSLTPQQTFQSKIEERIRTDIGELIPDEALAEIVERAMQKAFFEGRPIVDHWGSKTGRSDHPWFVQCVKDVLDKRVESAVSNWIASNDAQVTSMISEQLDAGISNCLVRAFSRIFAEDMRTFENNLEQRIRSAKGSI